jgi:aryl-alcohol dehydrogenase-like predicted oxidoreductase
MADWYSAGHDEEVVGRNLLRMRERECRVLATKVQGTRYARRDAPTTDDDTQQSVPPGPHKLRVELVNAEHHIFDECAECKQTVVFTVPETMSH